MMKQLRMIVCVALAQGVGYAAPDVPDSEGLTPLMIACGAKISGQEQRTEAEIAVRDTAALRALLNAGADVNSRDTMGRNVLHRALMSRVSPDMVKRLLEAGAELRQIHPLGTLEDTFLFDAVYHRQPAEVIQWLIDAGAAVNASEILTASAYAVDARVQTVLLAAGADPNRGNPLNAVIHQWADTSRARELIIAGADVNRAIGSTLCYADRREHLRLLLEHGADVNYRGAGGNTPFLVAVQYGNLPCLNMLVEAGANPLARNDAGQNARDILAELSAVGPSATWAPPGRKANPPLGDLDFARLYRCLDAVENVPEEQRAAAWKAVWER